MKSTSWRNSNRWRELPEIEASDLGRPRLRCRNPVVANVGEVIWQPQYDIYRVAVATAAPVLNLFAIAKGGNYNFGGIAAFQKTILHTNIVQGGQLASPNKFLVKALMMWVTGGPAPTANPFVHPYDLGNFQQSVYVEFDINSYPYLQTMPGQLPQGGGPWLSGSLAIYAQAAATVDGVVASSNGQPVASNVFTLAHGGEPIEQTQNFGVLIDPTQEVGGAFTTVAAAGSAGIAGTGLNVKVFLDGLLYRGLR